MRGRVANSAENGVVTRNLLIGGRLVITASAFAAPPPGADMTLAPWFHSLHVPGTRTLCCDISDCCHYPLRADRTQYQVFFNNCWPMVPTDAAWDRTDNPTQDHVTCRLGA